MIERQPYLPRFMAGGDSNPLGARALYLGNTLYRIHGTNQPSTIGTFVSSGCIRLTNEDIADLYSRVTVGTRVVVLPGAAPASASVPLAPSRAKRIGYAIIRLGATAPAGFFFAFFAFGFPPTQLMSLVAIGRPAAGVDAAPKSALAMICYLQ